MPSKKLQDLTRYKTPVAVLSVVSNTILVAAKSTIGVMIGSVAVLSEAIHSSVDLLASLLALFAVKTAIIPPDKNHPYGHGKVENLSGTVEALLIFLAAGFILNEAIHKLHAPDPLTTVGWGLAVMLASAIMNLVVSHFLFKVGRATDSVALEADAWHLRTDVYTSLGVLTGLATIWIGHRLWPGADLRWLDPLAAIGVALLIIKAAWELTVKSGRDMLDASLPEEELSQLQQCLARHYPLLRGFHKLRTRKAGATRFVEFHLLVERQASVEKSHLLASHLEKEIGRIFPGTTVTIHVEPAHEDPPPLSLEEDTRDR